jgi:glucosamine kinase
MRIFLGLDGGGSGCRAIATTSSGARSGVSTSGPANIFSAPESALDNIRGAAHAAISEVMGDLSLADALPHVSAVLGLAGATETNAARKIEAALGFGKAHVVGDVEAALKGAFQAADGVMASIGTGTVYASQRAGVTRRLGGYGLQLGDEGSGAWIGRAFLQRILHARDGMIPASDLTADVWRDIGGLAEMLRFCRAATPADYAAMAPKIIDAASSGDSVAENVVNDATAWIARALETLQQKAPLSVVFTGGLGAIFAQRLAGRWPTTSPKGSAAEGALWMAQSDGAKHISA